MILRSFDEQQHYLSHHSKFKEFYDEEIWLFIEKSPSDSIISKIYTFWKIVKKNCNFSAKASLLFEKTLKLCAPKLDIPNVYIWKMPLSRASETKLSSVWSVWIIIYNLYANK